jgi:hypothetical protein
MLLGLMLGFYLLSPRAYSSEEIGESNVTVRRHLESFGSWLSVAEPVKPRPVAVKVERSTVPLDGGASLLHMPTAAERDYRHNVSVVCLSFRETLGCRYGDERMS